jgi:hypothetical protein
VRAKADPNNRILPNAGSGLSFGAERVNVPLLAGLGFSRDPLYTVHVVTMMLLLLQL